MRTCVIVWTKKDVEFIANQRSVPPKLSDKEIDKILFGMEETHDETIGITWSTVDFWINIIINKRGLN